MKEDRFSLPQRKIISLWIGSINEYIGRDGRETFFLNYGKKSKSDKDLHEEFTGYELG